MAAADVTAPKAEEVEVKGTASGSEEEPELETAEDKHASRPEKKAKKALLKMGLKFEEGYTRVTMKKAPGVLFVIADPEVYHAPGTDTWVVFGEYKIEDLQARAREQYAQQMRQMQAQAARAKLEEDKKAARAPVEPKAAKVEEVEEVVDETGVEAKDIELVMAQASVSRAKAVGALKSNNGDVVNAIM
eukprot:Ihof_evm1s1257 gene=Ihof_evmTU1s1257